jgi:FkbM family methyltransferase
MEVGAGIGFLSAFCAGIVGSARVHAYEANPAMIEVIRETHATNRVTPRVVHAMLGVGGGSREFFIEPDFWASSTVGASPQAQRIEVPQLDLNAELRRVAPTFLVVDIEGGEAEFFAHADLSGVRKLCLETHPGVLGDAGVTRVFERLFAQGFVLDFSLIRKNVFYFHKPCA